MFKNIISIIVKDEKKNLNIEEQKSGSFWHQFKNGRKHSYNAIHSHNIQSPISSKNTLQTIQRQTHALNPNEETLP